MEKYPFINCIDPQRVKNRYTKELLLVPCGKCEACRNLKSMMATQKCNLESLSHKYCFFVTLTYSNEYVPTAKFVKYYDKSVLVADDGEILSECDYNQKQIEMLKSKCNHSGRINVLRKKDLQLFIKRLRKITNEKIRHYSIGEYGPVHFRPHYHLLLWFDREETSENIIENIRASWGYGRVDASISRGDCHRYVAKYVNSYNNLPQVLGMSKVRPFSIHSVYLGEEILRRSKEEVKKLAPTDFVKSHHIINGKVKDVTMWRSLASWYFPKCRGFNQLSDVECLPLYRAYKDVALWSGVDGAAQQTRYIMDDLYQAATCPSGDYYTYLPDVMKLIVSICNINVYNIPAQYEKVFRQIYSLLRTSQHFLNNVSEDGRHLYHIRRIKNFYSELAKERLIESLQLQAEYAEEFNCTDEEDFFAFYPEKYQYSNLKEKPIYKSYVTTQRTYVENSIKHKELNDANKIFNY